MRVEDKVAHLLTQEPIINFRLGDRYVNIIDGNELHRLSLKYNGRTKVGITINSSNSLTPYSLNYKHTLQYRTMIALGFRTRNGITYSYDDGEHDIWIRMYESKIQLIKDNLDYVDSVSYRYKIKNSNTAVAVGGQK